MPETQQIQLPDLTFKSAIAIWKGRLNPCAALWDGYALEDPVLESTPLKDVDWSTLFAYLHRRFGPPHMGGDDYKDLSAGWMLTTPDDRVFVLVSPSLSGPGFSFSPYYLKSQEESPALRSLVLPSERIEVVKAAFRSTLLDLLRPVGVRDHLINAMGELGDSESDQALQDCEEGNVDGSPYIVERHPSCGYPMPSGLFGGKEWATLCTVIRELGKGDMQAGRAVAIEQLQRPVFDEAAKQSTEVKRLMLMADFNQRGFLVKGLNLAETEVATLNADLETLSGPGGRESALVSELTLQDAETAIGFLSRLGLEGQGLKRRIKDLHIDKTVAESFRELQALPDQDFPDGAIPENVYDKKLDLADFMRTTFTSQSRQELIAWLDSTLARPYGREALGQIAYFIQSSAAELAEATPQPRKKSKKP